MSNIFEFEAQKRTEMGKAAARRMRRLEDKVPAVVYGAGKDVSTVTLMHKDVLKALKHEAVYSHILTLKVDGKAEKVVLKDIERHPSKPMVMHMDFLRVSANEKLLMHVPLHFEGEEQSPGLKAGGVLSKLVTDLEVSCLPANLPEFISVDISGLEMGQTIHLTQVSLPQGVELAHAVVDDEHDHAVVSIHQPKKEVEPEELEASVEAAAPSEASEQGEEEKSAE